jgi:hypothetical protein
MPVAFIQEFGIVGDDRSTTNYDTVTERLNVEADPPVGAIVHTAGYDEEAGVFRIFEVWETREACEKFLQERVMPIVEELIGEGADAPPPERQSLYELHGLVSL